MSTGTNRRSADSLSGFRARFRPMLTATNPHPGGLFFLLVFLVIPVYGAARASTGSVTPDLIALVVFAILFWASQWITPAHPLALRLALFAALTAVSVWGEWARNPEWLAAAALAAVACANLLPLMLGAAAGVVLVTSLSALVDHSYLNIALVLGVGAISILRGRLLVEIGRSRANRQAYAKAAVENERLRFARDLHDLLGHSLVTMMAKAELAQRLAGIDPAAAAAAAQDVREVGRTAMVQVQRVVAGYRTTSLADEIDQARGILEPLRIDVTTAVPARTWTAEVDTMLAWSVREAVTNVLRHSNASRCGITVTTDRRSVRLEVVNDAAGSVRVNADNSGGHGLTGLRERAEELGGTLAAAPRQGGGFRLAVEVPAGDTSETAHSTSERP